MAKIYGLAQRVIVWLGEDADDSAFVFQELCEAAFEADDVNYVEFKKIKCSTSMAENGPRRERRKHAILSLLQRLYFRRVWVSVPSNATARFKSTHQLLQ